MRRELVCAFDPDLTEERPKGPLNQYLRHLRKKERGRETAKAQTHHSVRSQEQPSRRPLPSSSSVRIRRMTPDPLVQIRPFPQRRLSSIPLLPSSTPHPSKQPTTTAPILTPRRRAHLPHLRPSPSLLLPLLRPSSSDIKVPDPTETSVVQPFHLPICLRPAERVRRKLDSNPRSLLSLQLTDVPRKRSTSASFSGSSGDGDDAGDPDDEGDSRRR